MTVLEKIQTAKKPLFTFLLLSFLLAPAGDCFSAEISKTAGSPAKTSVQASPKEDPSRKSAQSANEASSPQNRIASLEEQIKANLSQFRRALIVTDGVFSMDGDIAPLPDIYEVAKKYDILLMVDDAHGEGVLGKGGRGIVDHFGLHGKVDVEVGTMSKAFGVMGGIVAGKAIIIEWLRQRGRPFLFSSAMTVPDAAACLAAIDLLEDSTQLVDKLWSNAKYFKAEMKSLGFNTGVSETPITPVMLGEAPLAQQFSRELFDAGVFAMALGFPTVPQGKARIRVMISAAHSTDDLDKGLEAFKTVGKKLGVI